MKFTIAIAILGSSLSAFAQGTFENLNFEQAYPVAVGNGYPSLDVTDASALPYWTATVGGVQQIIPENF